MHSLPITAIAALGALYGLAWHNKPAREPARSETKPETYVPASKKRVSLNQELLAIWSLVAVSFAALLFTGYVIWGKCHGG